MKASRVGACLDPADVGRRRSGCSPLVGLLVAEDHLGDASTCRCRSRRRWRRSPACRLSSVKLTSFTAIILRREKKPADREELGDVIELEERRRSFDATPPRPGSRRRGRRSRSAASPALPWCSARSRAGSADGSGSRAADRRGWAAGPARLLRCARVADARQAGDRDARCRDAAAWRKIARRRPFLDQPARHT